MNKRKIMLLAAALVMVAVLGIGGTLAYFNDEEEVVNTFTVGNVDIELDEPKWDEDGSGDAEDVYPGEPLAKDPTVTNAGNNPCFVRVQVEGLDQFVTEFGEDAMITLRYKFADGYNTTDWTYYDGYYYYNKVLATKADAGNEYNQGLVSITTPVFDQIVMPTELTNNAKAEPVVVTAYAVQAQGARPSYSAVKAMTVEEIAAWFDQAFQTEQQ